MVDLLRTRASLLVTFALSLALAVLFPLYHLSSGAQPASSPSPYFWELNALAAFCVLGGWGLGALHRTARNEAEAALQRALSNLSESEGKLLSLIESTDDLVCSLDLEGRLLIANTAVKQSFAKLFGQEPVLGQLFFGSTSPERQALWKQRYASILAGQRLRFEEEFKLGDKRTTLETSFSPIRGKEGRITGVTIFSRDITARKQSEARLGEMHRALLDVSRQAGMAEMATGILHNVGNTLNSVNISANLITEKLRKLRVSGLAKASDLLDQHSADLGTFLTSDPKGQRLPLYFRELAQRLSSEQQALLAEMQSLNEGIEHLKSIVTMQQKHARRVGTVDRLPVPQLIDEALRLHTASFEREGIHIECDYAEVPLIFVDRHKLLQILMNLLGNARHALMDSDSQDKNLTIRVRSAAEAQRLVIEVADNGTGIAPENLPRMFSQGFTTKKHGHGFGLHISALTAAEMKGRLSCTSPGRGQGATFTLELPVKGENEAPSAD